MESNRIGASASQALVGLQSDLTKGPLLCISFSLGTRSVRIKLWQLEYDFGREDAEIAVPVILLVLGLWFTQFKREWLWAGTAAYYLLYFFLRPNFLALYGLFGRALHWWRFRCPYCKRHEMFLQGYEGYHSDEHYAYNLCNNCSATSVLVNDRLMKALSQKG
jgi:hypothetical protein